MVPHQTGEVTFFPMFSNLSKPYSKAEKHDLISAYAGNSDEAGERRAETKEGGRWEMATKDFFPDPEYLGGVCFECLFQNLMSLFSTGYLSRWKILHNFEASQTFQRL
ncbi:MAG: hypothetical protein CM15mP8_0290 [Methanobacteriota archaeon]|nr:MAG: hypothetical protein CM15mP8_0290 [Euryarchaeota archaeon]